MSAIVRSCTCKHPEQDSIYGSGKRVANTTTKSKDDVIESRCTVCGSLVSTRKEK